MGELPDNIHEWRIRQDQKYLYQIIQAINSGVCDARLASIDPGPISTARWLTTACRILRVYVSKTNPSQHLIEIVTFIIQVYAPFWFLVKNRPQAIHGSRNVFDYIRMLRKLPESVQEIVRPVVENNAYFFHPESIILSMITDENPDVREDAYEKIIAAREAAREAPTERIRSFHMKRGVIKFESETYTKMIDWNQFRVTEPPCLYYYAEGDLAPYIRSKTEIIQLPGKHFFSKH